MDSNRLDLKPKPWWQRPGDRSIGLVVIGYVFGIAGAIAGGVHGAGTTFLFLGWAGAALGSLVALFEIARNRGRPPLGTWIALVLVAVPIALLQLFAG